MAETKQSTAGLTQPKSQDPVKQEESKDVHVPAAIRGHKAVPAHPFDNVTGLNTHYKASDVKVKSFDECLAEHKARQEKVKK